MDWAMALKEPASATEMTPERPSASTTVTVAALVVQPAIALPVAGPSRLPFVSRPPPEPPDGRVMVT